MKKLLLLIPMIILLSGCSYNQDKEYDNIVYTYFETNEYETNENTIKITVDNDMTSFEIIAIGNLMLKELDKDITIKIYQYEDIIPTIITLQSIDNETICYTFNLKE
jgi:uncharacterized lipoprotein